MNYSISDSEYDLKNPSHQIKRKTRRKEIGTSITNSVTFKAKFHESKNQTIILQESLRNVKLAFNRLIVYNSGLQTQLDSLTKQPINKSDNNSTVTNTRFVEIQDNAKEIIQNLPKLIKLIKLLNKENRFLRGINSSINNEVHDILHENRELKARMHKLSSDSQGDVLLELTELFPNDHEARRVAESLSDKNSLDYASKDSNNSGTMMDQKKNEGLDNDKINLLVDLVTNINSKIENFNGNLVATSHKSQRSRRTNLTLDLSDAISESDGTNDASPERPPLDTVLDSILISE